MFRISLGEYELCCQTEAAPDRFTDFQQRATLAEAFDENDRDTGECFVSVARGTAWPFLVVAQRFSPAGHGFYPGAIVVPETQRLFLGAGRRLLCYDLARPARLWEDVAECGFWSWSRYGAVVLMAAELELAAWDLSGGKLWSLYVEPPWEFRVAGEVVTVDVMGVEASYALRSGEPI